MIFTRYIKPLFCKVFDEEEFEMVIPIFPRKERREYCRSQALAGQEAYDEDLEQAFSEDWTEIILINSSYMSWTVLFTFSHAV